MSIIFWHILDEPKFTMLLTQLKIIEYIINYIKIQNLHFCFIDSILLSICECMLEKPYQRGLSNVMKS